MTAVRLAFGAVIVLILGGLAGWYFYLHAQPQSTSDTGAVSNVTGVIPSFTGSSGSTQANQAIAIGAVAANSASSTNNNSVSPATSLSQLWQVDPAAVAGMGFVTTQTNEYLYYVERGNGYVFEAHPSTETTVRLTNTLMPKIYQALFADDGSVIERSIDQGGNVTTFLGTISASTTVSTSSIKALEQAIPGDTSRTPAILTGFYLQPNIRSIALDPVSKVLFYLVADQKGGVDGYTQSWKGGKQAQVFSSIVGSWRPYILQDGTMAVLESPADGIPGYAYGVSAAAALKPLVGNVPGLTFLPKASSSFLLYGSSSGSNLSFFAVSTSSPESLSLATVADKCVWLPGPSQIAYCAVPNGATGSNFLDNWYQGATHTSDDWWEIDLSNGSVKRIYSPSADNRSLDVENPIIDSSGNYIAFINATDQSLWVLRVAQ